MDLLLTIYIRYFDQKIQEKGYATRNLKDINWVELHCMVYLCIYIYIYAY